MDMTTSAAEFATRQGIYAVAATIAQGIPNTRVSRAADEYLHGTMHIANHCADIRNFKEIKIKTKNSSSSPFQIRSLSDLDQEI